MTKNEEAEWIEETETGIKRKVRVVSRDTPKGKEVEIENFYSGEGVASSVSVFNLDELKEILDDI